MQKFSLGIVGAGPTGLMCAMKLVNNGFKDIIIFDKGANRFGASEYNVTEGIGGAGSYSDSKMNLTHKVGGSFHEFIGLTEYYRFLHEQHDIWMNFSPDENQALKMGQHKDMKSREFKPSENASRFRTKSLASNLELDLFTTWHYGTDNMAYIVENMYQYLKTNGVTFKENYEIKNVVHQPKYWDINQEYQCSNLVIGTGRSGGHFVRSIFENNVKDQENLAKYIENNIIDIGIRAECPQEIGEFLTKKFGIYEPKLKYITPTFQDAVRSFCWCPSSAYVALEEYRDTGIKTVNGHSYTDKSSGNMNFAILVSQKFTEPFHNSQLFVESICRAANQLAGGGVLVQQNGDFKRGRRTTQQRLLKGATIPTLDTAVGGDITLALPYRFMLAIKEFMEALDTIIPGINGDHTLMYAVEAKFYNNSIALNTNATTKAFDNLYVGGDASSFTRGLNQSSSMGLWIGENILTKMN